MDMVTLVTLALAALLPSAPPPGIAWTPTLQSEFDSAGLDTTVWSARFPGTNIWNSESEAYVPSQVSVSGGLLHLRAERKPTSVFGIVQPYASGIVTTLGKWSQRYGYFEIQARMPAGKGFWPAFWGMPSPSGWPPEIDVLEILGDSTSQVHMTSHWGLLPLHLQKSNTWKGPDFSAGFHRFAVDWTPSHVRWYVDDTLRAENLQGVPNAPFYWLLNLAVGGTWPGYPDANTTFPSEFQIDWMRAWQYPTDSLAAFPIAPHLHFATPRPGEFISMGSTAKPTLILDWGPSPTQVRWYDGDTLFANVLGGALSASWTPRKPGIHNLRATATTSAGAWSDFVGTAAMVADSSGNLVTDGSFTDSTRGWILWTQPGCYAVADTVTWEGSLRGIVSPTAPGAEMWYVQFYQPLPLLKGWTYAISFQANGSVARTFQVLLQQGDSPWTERWSKTLAASTDSASYGPWSFTSPLNDSSANFKFNLGLDTASLRLWKVRVVATPPVQSLFRTPLTGEFPTESYDLMGHRLPMGSHASSGLTIERSGNRTRLVTVVR